MATKVDAVCLALTALWQGTAGLSTVQVVDSAQVNADPSTEWLFVGHDGSEAIEGYEVISAQQTWLSFNRVKQENAEVTCAFIVIDGGTDIPALRARAGGYLSAAEDAVRADPMLGGLVMVSSVTSLRYMPVITTAGAKVRLVFTVTYQAQL